MSGLDLQRRHSHYLEAQATTSPQVSAPQGAPGTWKHPQPKSQAAHPLSFPEGVTVGYCVLTLLGSDTWEDNHTEAQDRASSSALSSAFLSPGEALFPEAACFLRGNN